MSHSLRVCFLLAALTVALAPAQKALVDSLKVGLPALSDPAQRSARLASIAEGYVRLNADSALHYGAQAVAAAESSAQPPLEADAYTQLGLAQVKKSQLAEGLASLNKALALYEAHPNPGRQADCLRGVGNVAYTQGKFDEAMRHYTAALQIATAIPDELRASILNNNLAGIAYNQRDYPKAQAYYQEVMRYYEKIEDKQRMAQAYYNLGATYAESQDPKELSQATGYYLKAITIRRQLNLPNDLALSFYNLAYVYNKKGESAKAIEYMKQALATWTRLAIDEKIVMATIGLGDLYASNGMYAEGRPLLEGGLKNALEGGYKAHAPTALRALALTHEKAPDGNLTLAEQYYLQALAISQEIKAKLLELKYSSDLARLYAGPLKQPAKSLPYLMLQYDYYVANQRLADMRNFAESLAKTYSDIGDKKKAKEFEAKQKEYEGLMAAAEAAAKAAAEAEAAAKLKAAQQPSIRELRLQQEDGAANDDDE